MIGGGSPEIDVPTELHPSVEAGTGPRSSSIFRLAWAVFIENRLAALGLVVVILLMLFCFLGPVIYHTNQVRTNLATTDLGPSAQHLLGTDDLGYDLLGRLMVGGQTTMVIGLAVGVLATGLGVMWGTVAGFAGGAIDSIMMRAVDALLAIPALFLLLFIATVFIPSEPLLIVVISALAWLVPSRLVRAETLSVKTRQFVESASAQGARPTRIILRHLIPNVFGTVAVNATFQVADAILLITALSFLGLGIPPPSANWGSMLTNGVNFVSTGHWWLIWPPGVCIVVAVVAFNFIGDGLRDALDVRLQRR